MALLLCSFWRNTRRLRLALLQRDADQAGPGVPAKRRSRWAWGPGATPIKISDLGKLPPL